MTDKFKHGAAGFLLAFAGGFLPSAVFGQIGLIPLIFLFVVPIIGGIGKEVVDHFEPNNKFDWKDVWATFIGASILWIPGLVIYFLL